MATMREPLFWTEPDVAVPAVTAEQMHEVDRIAVDEFGLGILQMMENAGRNLALNVMDMVGEAAFSSKIAVLAGGGGNGGGGICCARHLHNRGFQVNLILDREASELRGAAAEQLVILWEAGLRPAEADQVEESVARADVVVDALIGYSLHGAPSGRAAELVELCNRRAGRVLSLDVPSGLNATTGEAPGLVVQAERTLTLALPKIGLVGIPGDLYVGDIGIPPEVYRSLGIAFEPFFGSRYWVHLAHERTTIR